MAFKRRAEQATTIDDEHAALRAQHAALEDLKRQLSERVEAVRERELELHHALADANSQSPGKGASNDVGAGGDTQRREQAVAQRERAVAAAEAELAARTRQLELDPANAETMVGVPPPAIEPPAEPDAERLAQIEARLAELREAEKQFLRTRAELAARSEAVAARERLVAQKERELDDREDGVGQWASTGLTEMEARLRRLEQKQDPSEQTIGFSGGLRKLQQGTTRPQRDS